MPLFCPCPWCRPSFSDSTRCQCLCSVLVRGVVLRFLNLRTVIVFVLSLSYLSFFISHSTPCQCICSVLVRGVVLHFFHLCLGNLPFSALSSFISSAFACQFLLFFHSLRCRRSFFPSTPCEFLCSAILRVLVVRSVHLRLANSLVLQFYAMLLFI